MRCRAETKARKHDAIGPARCIGAVDTALNGLPPLQSCRSTRTATGQNTCRPDDVALCDVTHPSEGGSALTACLGVERPHAGAATERWVGPLRRARPLSRRRHPTNCCAVGDDIAAVGHGHSAGVAVLGQNRSGPFH
jgi:hypothetical protein